MTDSAAGGAATPLEEAGRRARAAALQVARLPTGVKNDLLHDIADSLLSEADEILLANERDISRAEQDCWSEVLIDRLTLTYPRLGALVQGIHEIAAAPDPVGEVLRGSRRPNGLVLKEVRMPLGVVGVITEGRPNITIDAITLCLKAGNAVILLTGEEAPHSNRALLDVVSRSMARQGVVADAVRIVDSSLPGTVERFIHMRESLDLLIPRGSADLVRRICSTATVPTLEMGPGNCHIFIERTANLDMAADIAFNAKMQRPGMGNAMETLLVDEPLAEAFLPVIGRRMRAAGVELRGCGRTLEVLPGTTPASEDDWESEFLAPILAIRVVSGLEAALSHIARYGTHHSEAIVTQDYLAGKHFCERVDAAAVYINASTRFTDGFEFGLGAELGVSTQKLHRRGPIGLRSLTTWKWIIQGEGQVRD